LLLQRGEKQKAMSEKEEPMAFDIKKAAGYRICPRSSIDFIY
jgi:hypothetical protein